MLNDKYQMINKTGGQALTHFTHLSCGTQSIKGKLNNIKLKFPINKC